MSSSYSAAELEAMRKARIKRELAQMLEQMTNQLRTEHSNDTTVISGANIVISVLASDFHVGGGAAQGSVNAEALEVPQSAQEHDELDFSGLLETKAAATGRLGRELAAWISRIDERPVISEKDASDRARLITRLGQKAADLSADIEDRLRFAKMHIQSYLDGSSKPTAEELERIRSDYYEYCAMCELMDMKPTEKIPYRVRKEVSRMHAVLEKRAQDEYIMQVVREAMEAAGCRAEEEGVLDHVEGQLYSVDGAAQCDVFVGNDGRGIMFEPVGDPADGSLEAKHRVEKSAGKICAMYAKIEEYAAEKGVILRRVYADPANADQMCRRSDVSASRRKKNQRKTVAQKLKAMGLEG